jgi:hypothetical protein
VDNVADQAPDFDVHSLVTPIRGEGLVLRDRPNLAVSLVEALNCKFAVHDRDDDTPVPRRFRAVDDEQVAVVQVRVLQGSSLHMAEEGRGGMLDQVLMQVERLLEVVSGEGKSAAMLCGK